MEAIALVEAQLVLEVVVEAELGELVLQVHAKVHVLRGVHDDVDELHTGDHEVDVEVELVGVLAEEVHERLERIRLLVHVLEVVERAQHNTVAAIDQAHGREQLEHQRLGAVLAMLEAERDRVDRFAVADYHVKAILDDDSLLTKHEKQNTIR